ncbi:MAG: hypothetical protein UR19_C0016G0005 [Candidatus Nomurabacteria bacterium GW2011_GWF1_31_48]|uniref:Uncharacterized protein n=2 Tax=Patescibacteria group TaxID=1783273 RepID=A0A0G0BE24_9BACT|nr:MAG: hypothetical protein UR19_C0016G0005 [Candidatus Nomurabacteria bacterium GW2011_GWF1_31_48]KKT96846.1 MAG: hypothetical protein UW99_C0048G0006 [Candidatus Collierbacteria bacterium GW2011_GWC2_45_15]
MDTPAQIIISSTEVKSGYVIFKLNVTLGQDYKEYQIYASEGDIPLKKTDWLENKLADFAKKQMTIWIEECGGKLPINLYRVLLSGGRISTDDINSFLSINKSSSDLVRTNITIYSALFEWAKAKAQKEGTSFSDLVTRGLSVLRESDKEAEAWFREQGAYFRKKLGNFGSLEVFHYLPGNYHQFEENLLRGSLQKAEIRRTGWPIGVFLNGGEQRPIPVEDGIKAEYSDTPNLRLDYWYAKNKGEFYFSRILESDNGHGGAEPNLVLFFDTLIWRIAESLEHSLAYYNNLDIDGKEKVRVQISLYGLTNRTLSAWNQMRAFSLHHYKCSSDKSSWEIEVSLDELGQTLDDLVYDATKKLLVMFDFFVPNKDVVMDVLNREYRKSSM